MNPYYSHQGIQICHGDVLEVLRTLPAGIVQTVVTSPPYWGLRDYGVAGQIGLEKTPEEFVAKMVEVFREVRRVLRDDGTLWLNLGDSYAGGGRGGYCGDESKQKSNAGSLIKAPKWGEAGLKPKDLVGIPWRVAFALQADGWYLRSDIIWAKPNPMPESVTDRPTKAHEYIFLMSKSERYYYDADAIKEPAIYTDKLESGYAPPGQVPHSTSRPLYKDARSYNGKHSDKQRGHGRRHAGFNERWDDAEVNGLVSAKRNKRTVWNIATEPYAEAHFAVFPSEIPRLCIVAGSRPGDTVLDPFHGAGTTAMVAKNLGRVYIGAEINEDYIKMSTKRLAQDILPLAG